MGRRLGQHFLASASVLEKIAVAACPQREPLVIEIGPGQGALTQYVLERADRVVAIELDEPLVESLKARYPSLELVHSDVLDVDLSQWGDCVVVGNLPYYITSPIIDRILSLGRFAKRSVLMVQKEVAERLTARPGTRDYGFLTVATQSRSKVEYLFTVPRGAFRPPPKVDSAVVRLTPHDDLPPNGFLNFAGLCFHHKRKTLRNNLSAAYPTIVDMKEAGLRAEQLSIAELRSLYLRLLS